MHEVAVVIDEDLQPIFWHDPAGASSGYIPDSQELWDAIWDNREQILGIAHLHPGGGLPYPSTEDLTTFSAVERGLGLKLLWWIVSADEVSVMCYDGKGGYTDPIPAANAGADWVTKLRELGGVSGTRIASSNRHV